MPRLIWLPERGQPETPRLWFNPDHVTSVAPVLERLVDESGERFTLSVELKLQGMPVMKNWLAACATRDEADRAWQEFLTALSGNPGS